MSQSNLAFINTTFFILFAMYYSKKINTLITTFETPFPTHGPRVHGYLDSTVGGIHIICQFKLGQTIANQMFGPKHKPIVPISGQAVAIGTQS